MLSAIAHTPVLYKDQARTSVLKAKEIDIPSTQLVSFSNSPFVVGKLRGIVPFDVTSGSVDDLSEVISALCNRTYSCN